VRPEKQMLYMATIKAIGQDCEWARIYERLVERKCAYDERTHTYRGRLKVVGRLAGQITTMNYALLKADRERLASVPAGSPAPEPMLYDAATHRAHREGHYRPLRPPRRSPAIVEASRRPWAE
jgi:hypothetical protein